MDVITNRIKEEQRVFKLQKAPDQQGTGKSTSLELSLIILAKSCQQLHFRLFRNYDYHQQQSYDSHVLDNVPEAILSGTAGEILSSESRASSAHDSSQGHQSFDSTFLRYCARPDSADGEEAARSL